MSHPRRPGGRHGAELRYDRGMAKQSAGLLLYRRRGGRVEVFLVHPGGPFWAKKDQHAWSIPKGEFAEDEDPLAAARREFAEETGLDVDAVTEGPLQPLAPCRQAGGKVVRAWAAAGDCDPAAIASNTFTLEWPPRSGRMQDFPEVDRAGWFDLATARDKLHKGQASLLDELTQRLRDDGGDEGGGPG
jgi:predicted NUDIX family NTP pyrophosphohydrolase